MQRNAKSLLKGLFGRSGRGLVFDEPNNSPARADIREIAAWARENLTPRDIEALITELRGDDAQAADEPPPFNGRHRPGATQDPTSPNGLAAPQRRPAGADKKPQVAADGLDRAMLQHIDNLVKQEMKKSAAAETRQRQDRDFANRNPNVGRIRPDDNFGTRSTPRSGPSRSDASNASFETRFPVAGAARIKTI